MDILKITHQAGFFSCCSVRLDDIIAYFNKHKKLPDVVDSSLQFNWYKNNTLRDITFDYFKDYNNGCNIEYKDLIDYKEVYQFADYSKIDYTNICHFIKKYFSPSEDILDKINYLENKYIRNYDNVCVLFYRGNDKNRETTICNYNEYIVYAKKILELNSNIQFFIQSDETEFIEAMLNIFPNNSFYMKDEIRHMKKCNDTVDKIFKEEIEKFSKFYLAITIIMSKCKYIICGSGNCSIWIMFYRGNNKNIYQNKNRIWLSSIC